MLISELNLLNPLIENLNTTKSLRIYNNRFAVSYNTIIGVIDKGTIHLTNEKYSRTTSKHSTILSRSYPTSISCTEAELLKLIHTFETKS